MTLEERRDRLRRMWCGKYVKTERILDRDEFAAWVPAGLAWQPGFRFGGEGLVVSFEIHRDEIHIVMDYGMGWTIDEKTIITKIPPQGTMPAGVH